MNLLEAMSEFGFVKGEKYTTESIKQRYKQLLLKYHPDKSKEPGAPEKFIKITEAYNVLLKNQNNPEPSINLNNFFTVIKENLTKLNTNYKRKLTNKRIVISPSEYFTGTTKKITSDCFCDKSLCNSCSGCGYSITNKVCMDCLGDGWISNCMCYENVEIPSCVENPMNFLGKYKLSLDDEKYFFRDSCIYSYFDISLKESLLGFEKTFTDPFMQVHSIKVNDYIIKQNDGYSLKLNHGSLILLFNIIYPEKLSLETFKAIRDLEF